MSSFGGSCAEHVHCAVASFFKHPHGANSYSLAGSSAVLFCSSSRKVESDGSIGFRGIEGIGPIMNQIHQIFHPLAILHFSFWRCASSSTVHVLLVANIMAMLPLLSVECFNLLLTSC